jgi:hypothetical protein
MTKPISIWRSVFHFKGRFPTMIILESGRKQYFNRYNTNYFYNSNDKGKTDTYYELFSILFAITFVNQIFTTKFGELFLAPVVSLLDKSLALLTNVENFYPFLSCRLLAKYISNFYRRWH